jgi:hyaluronate lyase
MFDFAVKKGASALRAMKSYTVLDRAVAVVGTGVRLEAAKLDKGKTANSYIHQCPLRDSDRAALVNGKTVALSDGKKKLEKVRWMHVRNYGYLFPEPCAVDLSVGTSTRSYKYINDRYGSARTYTRRFCTISVDHGSAPTEGRYAAVVFPGVTANEMRGIAGRPGVRIATSGGAHLVTDEKSGTAICCFFKKGGIGGFRSERPLVVAVSAEGAGVHLTVQDPAHGGGNVTFRIPVKASGPGTKADGDGTSVTVKLDRGFPAAMELKK